MSKRSNDYDADLKSSNDYDLKEFFPCLALGAEDPLEVIT